MTIERSRRPAVSNGAGCGRLQGGVRLVVAVGLLAVMWLIVLPWTAARPTTATRLDWLEERGIDPSAMFYTELDSMQPILDRLERLHSEPTVDAPHP